ncbi:MAG: tetratricopeptide repeat protein [Anaerolineales bacterium]|jgi:tetratricopeptide (TPR) repeat protein
MDLLRKRWPLLLIAIVLLVGLRPTPVAQPLVAPLQSAASALAQDDLSGALESLRDALAFDPTLATLEVRAAEVAMAAGDPESALEHLAAAAQYLPGESHIACLRGEALHMLGDTLGAVYAWEEAAEPCPQPEAALDRRAAVLSEMGEIASAQDALEEFISQNPGSSEAHLQLGLLLATQSPEDALVHLQLSQEFASGGHALAQSLFQAIEESRTPETPALQLAAVGQVLIKYQEWQLAEFAFRNAIALEPGYAEARAYLGFALGKQGKDGLEELQTAIADAPEAALSYALLGMHLLDQGQAQEAIQELQTAMILDPENPAFAAQMGAAQTSAGDMIAAEDAYRLATELAPQTGDFWLLLARFSLDNGIEVQELGLPAARNAVVLLPDDPAAIDALAHAHLVLTNLPLAERLLWRSLSLNDMRAATQYHLGLLRLMQGDEARAAAALELAALLEPEGPIGLLAKQTLENLDF